MKRENNKENKIRKDYVTIFLFSVISITIIIAPIVFINPSIWGIKYDIKSFLLKIFISKDNAFNYLQYFGALVGGVTTLIAVLVTKRQADRHQEENKSLQYRLLKDQEDYRVRLNSFILANDLKVCFRDIFDKLVKFSYNNAKVLTDREERSDLIQLWKVILRDLEYSSEWRTEIKELSNRLGFNILESIYEIYILLDEMKVFYNGDYRDYESLYKHIELLPREKIFNDDFLDRYSELKNLVGFYDGFSNNEDFSEEDRKDILNEISVKRMFFEDLDLRINEGENNIYYEYLNDSWKSIFTELINIT